VNENTRDKPRRGQDAAADSEYSAIVREHEYQHRRNRQGAATGRLHNPGPEASAPSHILRDRQSSSGIQRKECGSSGGAGRFRRPCPEPRRSSFIRTTSHRWNRPSAISDHGRGPDRAAASPMGTGATLRDGRLTFALNRLPVGRGLCSIIIAGRPAERAKRPHGIAGSRSAARYLVRSQMPSTRVRPSRRSETRSSAARDSARRRSSCRRRRRNRPWCRFSSSGRR
jgi:hypothetical protein